MLSIKKLTAFAGRALKRVFVRIQGAAPAGLLGLALVACESSPPTDSAVAAAASAPAAAASTAAAALPQRPAPLGAASVPEPPASRASAPPPARTESHGYALHWQRPPVRAEGDGVTVVPQGWGRGVRLVVTSSAGVGQVEVRPVRGVWPHRVQVEFEYAAGRPFDVLEGVRFQVVNPAHTAGDEVPPLPPDGFSIWQRDGRFWVALPEGWLERQQTLRIGWVDRYRR